MPLTIGISTAIDPKTGMIVAHEQGASFSQADLKKIRAPYRFELWTSRGRSPVTVIHALNSKVAREYAKAKYKMRGLHLEIVKTTRRKI